MSEISFTHKIFFNLKTHHTVVIVMSNSVGCPPVLYMMCPEPPVERRNGPTLNSENVCELLWRIRKIMDAVKYIIDNNGTFIIQLSICVSDFPQ